MTQTQILAGLRPQPGFVFQILMITTVFTYCDFCHIGHLLNGVNTSNRIESKVMLKN